MDLTAVAYNLRRLRRDRGWTMQVLAKASGFTKATIHRLESGAITSKTAGQVPALAAALGVSVERLTRMPEDLAGPRTIGPSGAPLTSGTMADTGQQGRTIPVIASASSLAAFVDLFVEWGAAMPEADYCIVTISGDFLLPAVQDGDQIAVRLSRSGVAGDRVLVRVDGQVVIGHLVDDTRVVVLADGRTIPADDDIILAVLLGWLNHDPQRSAPEGGAT